jgi:hypothetical protein
LTIAQHAKIQAAKKRTKSLSTATSAATIPQNHPLDSLKTLYYIPAATNVVSDYLSLFAIRPWLIKCGTRPIFALLSGTGLAAVVVFITTVIRFFVSGEFVRTDSFFHLLIAAEPIQVGPVAPVGIDFYIASYRHYLLITIIPAIVVFAWLPLLAMGILAIRAAGAVSWLVGKAQWFLKGGTEHPLKAIGYVAATFVFVMIAGWHLIHDYLVATLLYLIEVTWHAIPDLPPLQRVQ